MWHCIVIAVTGFPGCVCFVFLDIALFIQVLVTVVTRIWVVLYMFILFRNLFMIYLNVLWHYVGTQLHYYALKATLCIIIFDTVWPMFPGMFSNKNATTRNIKKQTYFVSRGQLLYTCPIRAYGCHIEGPLTKSSSFSAPPCLLHVYQFTYMGSSSISSSKDVQASAASLPGQLQHENIKRGFQGSNNVLYVLKWPMQLLIGCGGPIPGG